MSLLATLGLVILTPAVSVGAVYLGMTLLEAGVWAAAAIGMTVVALALGIAVLRRDLEPLRRWTAGDEEDPEATWHALVRLPQQNGAVVATVVLPIQLATTYPLALALAEPGWAGAIGLGYAYVLVVFAGTVLITSSTQLLVRAAASDLGTRLRFDDGPLAGWWTLRRRLVLATVAAGSFAGTGTASLTLGGSASEGDYLVALLGGSALACYLAWMLDIGIFQPLVAPVQELIHGTRRVRRGDLETLVPVVTLDELGDLAAAFNDMQRGLRERAALHAAFGSYVDPSLAQRLLDSGSSVFEGEDLVVTVLFADVRDFTSYSEGVEPAEAVALLNRLFDVIVPVVHERGGHANHYLGDGLLAIFGAPNPLAQHADAALAAAVEIQRRVRAEFGDELRLGIGINTGPVIAGTVGGGGRHEFTVIGDTVNVAARVEQLTKETGDAILATEATRVALSPPRPRATRRGAFDLKGKSAQVTVHAVNPFPRSTR